MRTESLTAVIMKSTMCSLVYVSQERATSIFRVEQQVQQATSLPASYPEDSTLYNDRHENLQSKVSFKILLCHTQSASFISSLINIYHSLRKENQTCLSTDFTAALNAAFALTRLRHRAACSCLLKLLNYRNRTIFTGRAQHSLNSKRLWW